jgi:hypothetical protein
LMIQTNDHFSQLVLSHFLGGAISSGSGHPDKDWVRTAYQTHTSRDLPFKARRTGPKSQSAAKK